MSRKSPKLSRLTVAAMMGAVAFVLMYFSFSIPVLSPFAEFDLSGVAELIGGFILGPVGAVQIVVIKVLLKLLFKGTSSMFTGELQALLLGLAYVLPAVLYYRKHRTKKGAVMALVLGSACCVVVAVFTNLFIILPFFIWLYGMDWDSIVAMCSAVNPLIKDIPTMVAFSVVPFNVVSRSVVSFITLVIYKKISVPMKQLMKE